MDNWYKWFWIVVVLDRTKIFTVIDVGKKIVGTSRVFYATNVVSKKDFLRLNKTNQRLFQVLYVFVLFLFFCQDTGGTSGSHCFTALLILYVQHVNHQALYGVLLMSQYG